MPMMSRTLPVIEIGGVTPRNNLRQTFVPCWQIRQKKREIFGFKETNKMIDKYNLEYANVVCTEADWEAKEFYYYESYCDKVGTLLQKGRN